MQSLRTAAADWRLREHFSELLKLALPVMASRTGVIVMGTVDAIIIGHYDARQLAYYGLGHTPANVLIGACIGLLMGTVALTSHALGAGKPKRCGAAFRHSVPYAFLLGGAAAFLCQFGTPLFRLLGQPEELAEGAAPVLAILGFGFPGMTLSIVATSFLEGLKRPLPGLVAMIAGNILNALLCWTFVRGGFGLPEAGAVGSAWATTLVRTAMGVATLAYVWWLSDRDHWGVRDGFRGWWNEGRDQRRFGYAVGASIAIESTAFGALAMIAGMLAPLAVAAYTVFLNLLALPFMVAAGVAAATAVRVGVGYGRHDKLEMAIAGWTGLALTVILLAPVSVLYKAVPAVVAGVYTSDSALLADLAPVIAFGAWILVVDGAQVVLSNALRGRNDRWVPTALHFLSYAVVMLPLCAFLALALERGVRGLAEGILIASIVSSGVLLARFALLCR